MLVFDTSAYLNGWRDHYPPPTFPSVWTLIEAALDDARAISPREVYNELTRQDDDVAAWAKERIARFVEPSAEVQRAAGVFHHDFGSNPLRNAADRGSSPRRSFASGRWLHTKGARFPACRRRTGRGQCPASVSSTRSLASRCRRPSAVSAVRSDRRRRLRTERHGTERGLALKRNGRRAARARPAALRFNSSRGGDSASSRRQIATSDGRVELPASFEEGVDLGAFTPCADGALWIADTDKPARLSQCATGQVLWGIKPFKAWITRARPFPVRFS